MTHKPVRARETGLTVAYLEVPMYWPDRTDLIQINTYTGTAIVPRDGTAWAVRRVID